MPSVRLPIEGRSVAASRALLRAELHQHGTLTRRVPGTGAVENAHLMVSEVVTNAILHTRDLLLLEITLRGNTLYVAVVDDAPGLPILGRPDHHATGGRGLMIVNALADRWGCTPDSDHKTVWFELVLL